MAERLGRFAILRFTAGLLALAGAGIVSCTSLSQLTDSSQPHDSTAQQPKDTASRPSYALNQPDSFAVVTNWPMDALSGSNWVTLNNGSGSTAIVQDSSAPQSPPNVVQWLAQGPNMHLQLGDGSGTFATGGLWELYTGFWWKASAGWQGGDLLTINNPGAPGSSVHAGVSRLSDGRLILTTSVYAEDVDNSGLPNSWGGRSDRTLGGNVNGGNYVIIPGKWYHVELYLKWAQSIVRWWVDGTQVGDYAKVGFHGAPFVDLSLAPILPGNDTVRFDHVYVSRANRGPAAVTDFAASNPTDSTVTFSFTQTDDGTDWGANYQMRYAAGTLNWSSAPPVSSGSCAELADRDGPNNRIIGFHLTCQVANLTPGVQYQFQLLPYRGTLNQNAILGPLSAVVSATTSTTETRPGTVTDLKVDQGSCQESNSSPTMPSCLWPNAVSLSWTETDDGYGKPAWYDVRYSTVPISWGSATSVQHGTCVTPDSGWYLHAHHYCYIVGLSPGTAYQFQVMAFRGTLNQAATLGEPSNIASATTAARAGPIGTATITRIQPGETSPGVQKPGDVLLFLNPTDDGTNQPLSYEVRFASPPMSWSSATRVTQGSCATFTASYSIGSNGCHIEGLASGATYQFQLVAYRGTLDKDAEYGGLSNIVTATAP